MSKEKFLPENALEKAVIAVDNAAVVDLISRGAHLERPDVLAADGAFNLRYPVAVLLLESSPCLRDPEAVKYLETLGAHPEMLDLVSETAQPLPENIDPQSDKLIDALFAGEDYPVADLIANEMVTLSAAPLEAFDNMEEFCKFTVCTLFEKTIGKRLQAQLFLHLRSRAGRGASPRAELFFELMKILICEVDTPVRHNRIHALWRYHTVPPFVREIEREPEKFTDDYLAAAVMDQDLELSVRAFKDFPPYYQALLLNNAGVTIGQFDDEALIEKFEAKAVFELLSAGDEYADRVDWILVNLTAKASDFLKFLSAHPRYAGQADWKMINIQAEPEHWLDFLEAQPGLLECCHDHQALYMKEPDRWEQILADSGLPQSNCFAYLERDDDPGWEYSFKVRVLEDRAEFFEVNDLYTYKKFSALSRCNFAEFSRLLQDCGEKGRFVNIIR